MIRFLFLVLLCLLIHQNKAYVTYSCDRNENTFVRKEVDLDCIYCFSESWIGNECKDDENSDEIFIELVQACVHPILAESLIGEAKDYSTEDYEKIIEEINNKTDSAFSGSRTIHMATVLNMKSTVEYLLKKNATYLEEEDDNGLTPFLVASAMGRLEVLKLLLEKGANSKATDCLGNNALHLAVKISNNTDTIKYLVEHVKLDVNSKNEENETALHLVSYYGYMSTVDYLVEKGAQVDARDKNNDMPLHIAASYGNQALIKLLLNIAPGSLNAADNFNRTALMLASHWDHLPEINYLLEQKEISLNQQDDDGKTALHFACGDLGGQTFEGKTQFELIFQKRPDLELKDNEGRTVLIECFRLQKWPEVKKIIENGVKLDIEYIDNDGRSLLHQATEGLNQEMVELLLNNGADVNLKDDNGLTPTMIAVERDSLEMLKLFISHNADLDLRTNDEKTLLHLACDRFDLGIVQFLIEKGLDVEARDSDGRTPLHYATITWFEKFPMKELLRVGANVNAKDNNGTTPLHLAARGQLDNEVKLLIEKGADIYAKNNEGKTAIHECFREAPFFNFFSSVSALVKAGSNLLGKDNMGQTPFSLALSTLETDDYFYSKKFAVQHLFNLIKDDQAILDTIAIKLLPTFGSSHFPEWTVKLYDAEDNLICTTGEFRRFTGDGWEAGATIELKDEMVWNQTAPGESHTISFRELFGECGNFTFTRTDPPPSLSIELIGLNSWSTLKVDKLQVKFNVGPNPTQIYEALNVGDSKTGSGGYHHLKKKILLLKPSETFCCQNINVTNANPDISGEYYLNYQKSNSTIKVYVRTTEPEMLLHHSDNLDWTFGLNMEQKVASIPGSSDVKCPDEIKEKKIQQGFVEFQCEKFPGPIIESQPEDS